MINKLSLSDIFKFKSGQTHTASDGQTYQVMVDSLLANFSFPIYWELLDKRGDSDTAERIALITKFINHFGKDCIAGILADCEFVGDDWFSWLMKEKIFFYIRIKKNFLTTDSRGRPAHVYELFRGIKPTEERILYGKRIILGSELS